jgi:hypothetical protein
LRIGGRNGSYGDAALRFTIDVGLKRGSDFRHRDVVPFVERVVRQRNDASGHVVHGPRNSRADIGDLHFLRTEAIAACVLEADMDLLATAR